MNKEVIYIRLDAELKRKLELLAKQDNRSLNGYIVNLLSKEG